LSNFCNSLINTNDASLYANCWPRH
jgi:hypothetical protein